MITLEAIKEKKEQLGYSYEKIASISGVPLGTVQKVLGGITKSPRYPTIMAIAAALGLCGGSEAPQCPSKAEAESLSLRKYQLDVPSPARVAESAAAYSAAPREEKGRKLTRADRDALPEERRTELIDGVLYDMPSPRSIHQIISGHLYSMLLSFVTQRGGACMPFIAPMDVILDNDEYTVVQPDVFVVCEQEKIRDYIYCAPDLVIEVLSPSTKKKDMGIKYWKYFSAGVREYWLIDPKKQSVVVYNFDAVRDSSDDAPPHISLYGFESEIPVAIWNGECVIDMKIIKKTLESLHLPD